MQDLIVSITENILKISTVESGEFKGVSAEIATGVVNNQAIQNPDELAAAMQDLISTVTKRSHRSLNLNFIVEPHDTVLKFITVPKNGYSTEDALINEIKSKVNELPLEEMYFSYIKVAPFVYQFIGIKKTTLENYVQISNTLGINIKGVFPWILLMPKTVATNEPAIFLSRLAGRQVMALSELGGIFFSGVYEQDKSTEEMQKLVKDLSVYKRSDPIGTVYVHNYEGFSLNSGYNVIKVEIPNADVHEAEGYDLHLLLEHMQREDPKISSSKFNLLNFLPVPVVYEKKNMTPVYIMGGVLGLVLVGFIGYSLLVKDPSEKEVLENTQQPATTLIDQGPEPVVDEVEEEPAQELNKEDITIRIENGAGIAGIAGRTQEFLEEAGFTITSVGNSDIVGKTTTTIKIKSDKAQYQDLLVESMKDSFTTEVEEDLSEAAEYDVLITVGSDADL